MSRYAKKVIPTLETPFKACKDACMALLTDSKHFYGYVVPTELNEFAIVKAKMYEHAEGWEKAYKKFDGGHYMTAEEAYKVIEYAYQHTKPTEEEFAPAPKRRRTPLANKATAEVPVKELDENKEIKSQASIKADENQPPRKRNATKQGKKGHNKASTDAFEDFLALLDAKNNELDKAYELISAQRKTNEAQDKVLRNLAK